MMIYGKAYIFFICCFLFTNPIVFAQDQHIADSLTRIYQQDTLTGLALSLSYDIIKAHGGELNVTTEEGMFTAFIIQLPIKNHHTNEI